MEITTAVLADAANTSQEGKLNITGIFDGIGAGVFPATWPMMVLVIRIEAHRSETGQHNIMVRVVDEDGKMMSETEAALDIGEDGKMMSETEAALDVGLVDTPAMPLGGDIILRIANATFPGPGLYSFDILIDGRYEGSARLLVQALQSS